MYVDERPVENRKLMFDRKTFDRKPLYQNGHLSEPSFIIIFHGHTANPKTLKLGKCAFDNPNLIRFYVRGRIFQYETIIFFRKEICGVSHF
jgi:hypothetical protein